MSDLTLKCNCGEYLYLETCRKCRGDGDRCSECHDRGEAVYCPRCDPVNPYEHWKEAKL